jgi:hypothetical protein
MNLALRIYPGWGKILMEPAEILNAVFICRHKEEARSSFLKKRSKRLLQIQM